MSNTLIVNCISGACGCVGLVCCLFSAGVSLTNYSRIMPVQPVSITVYAVILLGGVMLAAVGFFLSTAIPLKSKAYSLWARLLPFGVNTAALIAYAMFLFVVPRVLIRP